MAGSGHVDDLADPGRRQRSGCDLLGQVLKIQVSGPGDMAADKSEYVSLPDFSFHIGTFFLSKRL
jgi:hypothetical protein